MKSLRLSKSRILSYLQCPKRLYLQVHRPELAETSSETERAFAAGHAVGDVARGLFPGGILIGHDHELAQALRETREALTGERPIYEATFEHDGVLIRADILLPNGSGHQLVEVKSSTEIKDYHLPDCAVQTWVTRNAGLRIDKVELAHIDNSFVYPGNNDYRGLLKHVDVTNKISPLLEQVPRWVEECQRMLAGPVPEISVGPQCSDPFACPFLHYCAPLPETEYPVTLLPNDRHKRTATELGAEGFRDIREVPAGRLTNPRYEWIRRITVNGKFELDPAAGNFLRQYPYPRYYLDFETIQFAVPIWAGTRPYQMLPFQWSCHIETAEGDLLHESYLGIGPEAPMRDFTENLLHVLTTKEEGPIFVYNIGFEAARIREMAMMFPDLADKLTQLLDRLIDLKPIAQKYYYHPDMKGSWSLKAVFPTIEPDAHHGHLQEVQDGGMAMDAYLEIISPDTDAERKVYLTRELEEYCKLDTLAMVKIARFFQGLEQPC